MGSYCIFVHLTATPAWLALSRSEREQFVADKLQPILATYSQVQLRFYDVEFFSARCSDIITFETDNLASYAALMDCLRDTPLFSTPYFTVNDILPATVAAWV